MELDGARSASGATDGESVYERANEELAPSGAVLVQYVPGSINSFSDASLKVVSIFCLRYLWIFKLQVQF